MKAMRALAVLSCLLGAWLAAVVPAVGQDTAATADTLRAEFLAGWERARSGLPPAGEDSPALADYILFPYLEAARLGRALDAAAGWDDADTAVLAFLDRHAGEPVTRNLETVWLRSLAERGLDQSLVEHFRAEAADTALTCEYLAARIALGETGAIAAPILDVWLTGWQLPLVCEPVFQWLREAGPLDDDMTAARVRLLLDNEQAPFARIIAGRLPDARAAPLLARAELIEQPLAAIDAWLAGNLADAGPDALLEGWARLARDYPDAALERYDVLIATEDLAPAQASPVALATALGLAWDRRPEALDYFARAGESALDDYALGWLARAALWAAEPERARAAIAAMSQAERDASSWRYWAGQLSQDDDSREMILESILPDDNYYSAAAAARLRDRVRVHPVRHERDPAIIAGLAELPAIRRASELRLLDLPVAAVREWYFAAAGFTPAERDQSVHLASELGWFDLAIATATELRIFYDYELLYPRPHAEAVDAAAREFDLEPALLYAVMRQESLYRPDAESAAGARGLMQLRPGTAAGIARSLGAGPPGTFDLLEPATNIRIGAAELARLLERYDGHLVVALAAYNAGPAAADRWLPPEPVAGDVWLENVPFNETRDYVRRVLWNIVVFEWLENDRVDARDWLEPVGPR